MSELFGVVVGGVGLLKRGEVYVLLCIVCYCWVVWLGCC